MKRLLSLLLIIGMVACEEPPPATKLTQFEADVSYEVKDGTLVVKAKNPVKCPLRTKASSENKEIQKLLDQHFPITLTPLQDTIFSYSTTLKKGDFKIKFSLILGDLQAQVKDTAFTFPFQEGRGYKVIQGYNGTFSHKSTYSKYAIDFDLAEGDTVCAAASGYVVGIIEEYTDGSDSEVMRDFSNFITVFHPESNLYTQYVHLKHKGSLVKLGDQVQRGQAIGLSGLTGYTASPHLHFNVLTPIKDNMASRKASFIGGFKGDDLRKGERVQRESAIPPQ